MKKPGTSRKRFLPVSRVKETIQNKKVLKEGSERVPMANFTYLPHLFYNMSGGHLCAPIRESSIIRDLT